MDHIFKILEVVMSITSAKSQTISKQVMATVRKLIVFVIIALACMALFCVGVSMVVIDVANQIEKPLIVGSILAVLSLSIFFICLSQKAWMKAAAIKSESNKSTTSPVEEALALLIKDIVEERQMKRLNPQSNHAID